MKRALASSLSELYSLLHTIYNYALTLFCVSFISASTVSLLLFQVKPTEYIMLLCEAMKTNTHVCEIQLARCGLHDNSATMIGEMLKTNQTLKVTIRLPSRGCVSPSTCFIPSTVFHDTLYWLVAAALHPRIHGFIPLLLLLVPKKRRQLRRLWDWRATP